MILDGARPSGWDISGYAISSEPSPLEGATMGEIVLAAKITHVPSIWLSLQPGKHHGIRAGAEKALKEVARRARERGADTYVIADTHWMNTIGFHLNAKARHSGS